MVLRKSGFMSLLSLLASPSQHIAFQAGWSQPAVRYEPLMGSTATRPLPAWRTARSGGADLYVSAGLVTRSPPFGRRETAEVFPRRTTVQSAEYFAAAVVRMPSARQAFAGNHVPFTPSVTGCGARLSVQEKGYD